MWHTPDEVSETDGIANHAGPKTLVTRKMVLLTSEIAATVAKHCSSVDKPSGQRATSTLHAGLNKTCGQTLSKRASSAVFPIGILAISKIYVCTILSDRRFPTEGFSFKDVEVLTMRELCVCRV